MSASLSHSAAAEPNLTPMLDMVFQLITFFMLVINFKSASMDLNMKLPVVGSARPVETKGQEDLLVLNINQQGEFTIYGVVRTDIENYLTGEAQASLLKARLSNPLIKVGDDLPTTVVIRADVGTRFSLLNRVIMACQERGFRKFALKAMNRTEET
jgi:biopolymer transport protein ExbD